MTDNEIDSRLNVGKSLAVIALIVFLCACITYYLIVISNNNQAKFSVQSLISAKNGEQVIAFTQLDLRISPQLADAINSSVPIYINVESAYPKTSFLIEQYSQKKTQQFRLERHALSENYTLNDINLSRQQNFDSINAALSYLGQSFQIILADVGENKEIAVRAYVDLSELPSALRFKQVFSRAWLHDSGWSIWPLEN